MIYDVIEDKDCDMFAECSAYLEVSVSKQDIIGESDLRYRYVNHLVKIALDPQILNGFVYLVRDSEGENLYLKRVGDTITYYNGGFFVSRDLQPAIAKDGRMLFIRHYGRLNSDRLNRYHTIGQGQGELWEIYGINKDGLLVVDKYRQGVVETYNLNERPSVKALIEMMFDTDDRKKMLMMIAGVSDAMPSDSIANLLVNCPNSEALGYALAGFKEGLHWMTRSRRRILS